jgi:hypothetical protein
MRGPIALLAGVLAAALILAGCGGGGSDSSTASGGSDSTTAPLDKAAFIAKADAICSAGGEKAQSEFVTFTKENKVAKGKELTTAQWEEIGTGVLVPALQAQADEIRQLGIPAGDEVQVEAFLEGVDEAVEKLEENPQTAKSPSTVLADAHEAIDGYGFKVCGGEK